MSYSTSKLAYDDCYAILDRALNSENGIRVACDTKGKGWHLLSRLNYARTIDRNLSREVYNHGDPEYGVSQYDTLSIKVPYFEGEEWWVQIYKRTADRFEIEELEA